MRKLLPISLYFLVSASSQAACSRPILVPAPPLGKTVESSPHLNIVTGVYPELLREYGEKAGCQFKFLPMPWVRAEMAVQSGKADILLSAVQVPERDAWGRFIALVGADWKLVSLRGDAPPRSVDELLARPGVRVNAVRSFKYGPEYQAMLDRLARNDALEYVSDPLTLARKMVAGRADYAFLASYTFAGALDTLGVRAQVANRVSYSHLDGILARNGGAYLSQRLSADDAEQVAAIFEHIRSDGAIAKRLRKFFSATELSSLYPLPDAR